MKSIEKRVNSFNARSLNWATKGLLSLVNVLTQEELFNLVGLNVCHVGHRVNFDVQITYYTKASFAVEFLKNWNELKQLICYEELIQSWTCALCISIKALDDDSILFELRNLV